jgi:hypothetical protein
VPNEFREVQGVPTTFRNESFDIDIDAAGAAPRKLSYEELARLDVERSDGESMHPDAQCRRLSFSGTNDQ